MPKFKVGDIIRCIDTNGYSYIHIGDENEVLGADEAAVYIQPNHPRKFNTGEKFWYADKLFVHASSPVAKTTEEILQELFGFYQNADSYIAIDVYEKVFESFGYKVETRTVKTLEKKNV